MPYTAAAILCGLVFGHFLVFFLLALLAFIFTQLMQLYHFQKWCADQSSPIPSAGLNRIWKNIYFILETHIYNKPEVAESAENKLQAIAESDYGFVLLKDNRIEWFNEQAGALLKLDINRDSGSDISHSLRLPNFLDALNKKHYGQEIILENRQPPIAVCLIPYGEQHLCMLLRDLSRFMALKNTNQELLDNVAHELRSPLTVIHGYLEILEDINQKTKNEDLKKILDNMQIQVTRLKTLVDNTLTLTSLENTELDEHHQSRVDVPAMLQSILEMPKMNTAGQRFDTQIDAFHIHGSASELHSVFYNLIDNAMCHSQSEEIKIAWYKNDQGAYFEVTDKGIGIEAFHLSKLSKRFYRVNQARSGSEGNTGLGLAIVKHVLNRHQATLEIESEPGKGSTFRCCFPLARVAGN